MDTKCKNKYESIFVNNETYIFNEERKGGWEVSRKRDLCPK